MTLDRVWGETGDKTIIKLKLFQIAALKITVFIIIYSNAYNYLNFNVLYNTENTSVQ